MDTNSAMKNNLKESKESLSNRIEGVLEKGAIASSREMLLFLHNFPNLLLTGM